MTRPQVSPAADDLYRRLGDGMRRRDELNGWLLLLLCQALATAQQPVNDLADSDWTTTVDPATADDLRWLGQWVGIGYDDRVDPEANRQRIRDRRQWQRGTLEAIRAAAAETLTPGGRVDIFERNGGPYKITVVTYASHTPNPAATLAALRAAVPAGHPLTYSATNIRNYLQLGLEASSYTALGALYDNYIELGLGIGAGIPSPRVTATRSTTWAVRKRVPVTRRASWAVNVIASSPSPGLPARAVMLYWAYYAPVEDLSGIDAGYNLITLFEADPVGGPPGSTGAVVFNKPGGSAGANLNADIAAKRAAGKRFLVTIGGAGAQLVLDTRARSQAFVNSVIAGIDSLGPTGAMNIDGLDLNNYEGALNLYTSEWIWACQQLKNRYGPNFFFTSPPSCSHWQNQIDRDAPHLAAMHAAGVMDLVNPQFYDGPGNNTTSQIRSALDFFKAAGLPNSALGIGFGIDNGSNPTWWTAAQALAGWNSVIGSYPGLRGGMCFSKEQDPSDTFATVVGPTILAS